MAVLAVVMMVTSCSDGNEIAKAIPANSTVVLKTTFSKLAEKSALDDNKDLQTQIQEAIKNLPESEKAKAQAIIDDPMEAGFSLQKPVFCAITDTQNGALVISIGVDDKAKVTELFKTMQKETPTMKITEGEDITTVEDQDMQIAYNSNLCVIAVKNNATELIKQEESKSILSQDKYDKFLESNNDIDAFIDYASALKMAQSVSKQPSLSAMDKLTEGVYIIAGINFEDKKAVINTEVFGNDKLIGLIKDIQEKPSGDYLKLVPENAYMVTQCGIENLDKIAEFLPKAESEQINQQLQAMGLSLEQILKAVDGDILVSLAPNGSQSMPQMAFVLACKDQKIWETITKTAGQAAQGMLTKKDENSYTINTQAMVGVNYNISYDKKAIVLAPETAPAKSFKDNDNASVLKDGGFFIDFKNIMANEQVKKSVGPQTDILSGLATIYGNSEGTKSNYYVTFSEDGNALTTIIKMIQAASK